MSYYSVLAGWGLHYFFLSLGKFWEMKTPEEISSMFLHLKGSGSLCLFWHVCFISLATIIISRGVRHGIESWARIGTTLLLGLLIILFLVSTTLPGFHEAASFLLSCDFSNLTQTGLLEALGLSLFTLSLGQGIMITYGSYMKDESIPKTAAFVVGMVIIGSFLSAFSIFPALFTFHISAKSGLGLVFQTLPTFFATLPGAVILCPLFFLLFVCAALGASLGLLEACVATLIDLYHWSRKKAAFTIGFAVGIFGIPSALGGSDSFLKYTRDLLGKPFLEFLDHTVSSWILPLTALGICCFAGYILPKHLFKDEFSKPVFFHLWYFLIRYVVPVSIILVVIHRSGLMHFSS
jgi:NSS family neurotransmitter:Na+ symporter